MAKTNEDNGLNTQELQARETEPFNEDELYDLFSAFDEVSASSDLQNETLERIFAADDSEAAPASTTRDVAVSAVAGGKHSGAGKRSKWRAIRVAAVAACLAMALGGGVAYATPAQYYEIAQGESTITLGVNCFGMTVSATSDDEVGKQVIDSVNLRGVSYEESLARAIDSMEQHNSTESIEYGPRGGEHETVPPAQPQNNGPDAEHVDNPGNDFASGKQSGEGDPQADQPQDFQPDNGSPSGDRPEGDASPHHPEEP